MLPRSMLISPIMAVTSCYRQVLDYELLEAVVCKWSWRPKRHRLPCLMDGVEGIRTKMMGSKSDEDFGKFRLLTDSINDFLILGMIGGDTWQIHGAQVAQNRQMWNMWLERNAKYTEIIPVQYRFVGACFVRQHFIIVSLSQIITEKFHIRNIDFISIVAYTYTHRYHEKHTDSYNLT